MLFRVLIADSDSEFAQLLHEAFSLKGYVCTVCGWVYEGDTLPDDIVCPLCKHGAADFEEIK